MYWKHAHHQLPQASCCLGVCIEMAFEQDLGEEGKGGGGGVVGDKHMPEIMNKVYQLKVNSLCNS